MRPENMHIVRMAQSAEVTHALLHKRSYKPAFGPAEAREAFERIFLGDPECLAHFDSFMRMHKQKGALSPAPQ